MEAAFAVDPPVEVWADEKLVRMVFAPPHSWFANTSGEFALSRCGAVVLVCELEELWVLVFSSLVPKTEAKVFSFDADALVVSAAFLTEVLPTPEARW